MRILIDEFVTGGGWYCTGVAAPPESLLAEGNAMLQAAAADFSAIQSVHVEVTRDGRFGRCDLPGVTTHVVRTAQEAQHTLAARAAAADWSLIIAPEFDAHLLARCRTVEQEGGTLLGPSSRLVALTSDKHATAQHLAAHAVSVPAGVALAAGDRLPLDVFYPAVLKPRDGAGSQGIELIRDPRDAPRGVPRPMRLEAYCPGTPASVAFLCGPRGVIPLAACRQSIRGDGHFEYLGGSLPLETSLAERAVRLATRAVDTLESPLGYLGVDLVLGHDPEGTRDVVVEINPRITTSYVGLRALARGNLAAAMLAIAEGKEVELSWHPGPIQFEAAGRVCVGCVSADRR